MSRFLAKLVLALGMLGMPFVVAAADKHLPLPQGLTALAEKSQPVAVAILFSAPDCTYCEQVRQQSLWHLETDKRYQPKVLAFEIEQESDAPSIEWFNGKTYSGRQISKLLGVKFSPTVMVFNSKGIVAGQPILGSGLPDFYGAYLDDLIRKAWALPF